MHRESTTLKPALKRPCKKISDAWNKGWNQELRSLTLLSPEKRLQRQAERLKDAMIRLESAWRFRLLEARRTSAGLEKG